MEQYQNSRGISLELLYKHMQHSGHLTATLEWMNITPLVAVATKWISPLCINMHFKEINVDVRVKVVHEKLVQSNSWKSTQDMSDCRELSQQGCS